MNAYIAVSCLLALVNVASASGGLGYGYGPALGYDHGASLGYDHGGVVGYAPVAAEVGSIPNPGYSFNYAVNDPHTGDNKAQWETRHGDVVTGSYSLVEPDGNLRVVEYTADPIRGFNAVVKRTGPNVHSVALPAKVAVAPVAIAPIAHELPIAEPIYPAPILDYHIEEPWLHGAPTYLSGSSYGHSGHMVRRWAAGPIDLHGKTLTIKTKH